MNPGRQIVANNKFKGPDKCTAITSDGGSTHYANISDNEFQHVAKCVDTASYAVENWTISGNVCHDVQFAFLLPEADYISIVGNNVDFNQLTDPGPVSAIVFGAHLRSYGTAADNIFRGFNASCTDNIEREVIRVTNSCSVNGNTIRDITNASSVVHVMGSGNRVIGNYMGGIGLYNSGNPNFGVIIGVDVRDPLASILVDNVVQGNDFIFIGTIGIAPLPRSDGQGVYTDNTGNVSRTSVVGNTMTNFEPSGSALISGIDFRNTSNNIATNNLLFQGGTPVRNPGLGNVVANNI